MNAYWQFNKFIKCPHLARPEPAGKVHQIVDRRCQHRNQRLMKETLHRSPLQLFNPASRHKILVSLLVEEPPLLIAKGAHQCSDVNKIPLLRPCPWLRWR